MAKELFYDFGQIKEIPLERVCRELYNIDLKERRGKLVGSIRNEKEASFEINIEKNIWYDFGMSKGGSTTELVQTLDNVDWKKANQILGEAFGLSPINASKDEKQWQPLSDSQYARIGIQADAVSKNIDFDLSRYTQEQAKKLSDKFSKITIQQLAVSKPKSYHQILQRKAIPFVYETKQDYLRMVLSLSKQKEGSLEYTMLRQNCEELQKQYKEIYELLKRAVQDKAILVGKLNISDLDTDLEKMKKGELQCESGNILYSELKSKNEKLRYLTVSDEEFEKLRKSDIEFACYSKFGENKVVVTEANFMNALAKIERPIREIKKNNTVAKAENKGKTKTVNIATAENKLQYFSELATAKQDIILAQWYQRKIKRAEAKGNVAEIKELEYYRELFQNNKSFKYDSDLKAHRVSNTIEKYGTVSYAAIKENQPLYMTYNDIDSKELFLTLENANFPYSARVIGDNVKITIPKLEKEKFDNLTQNLLYKNTATQIM